MKNLKLILALTVSMTVGFYMNQFIIDKEQYHDYSIDFVDCNGKKDIIQISSNNPYNPAKPYSVKRIYLDEVQQTILNDNK